VTASDPATFGERVAALLEAATDLSDMAPPKHWRHEPSTPIAWTKIHGLRAAIARLEEHPFTRQVKEQTP
jgi:hypothetical protein